MPQGGSSVEKGKLIQKVGIITQKVAAELIALDEGDRVPTVVELSERYGVSRGTVQTAFSLLREEGAIVLQPRGHMGTFLTFLDRIKLIEFAGVQTLVGVMPLPYSKKYEGLATGIYETLQNSGLSAVLAFMHGSDHRLEGLAERRYDFAVMSQLTAQYYIDRGEPVRIVENFGHYSYVGRHVLLVREDYDKTGIHRVGVDNTSVDQKTLTRAYFGGSDVEYVPLIYNQIIHYLNTLKIDAAVWNLDDIDLVGNHLKYKLLDDRMFSVVDTEAVVICRRDNELVYHLLRRLLERESVLRYQKEVLEGKITPHY